VILNINDKFQSKFILSDKWTDYTISVPTNIWKKVNKFIFKYPKTYFPCLLREGIDEKRRCAIFSKMSAVSVKPVITIRQKKFHYVASKNLISDDKWKPWRNANHYTNQLKFLVGENPPAPFKKGGLNPPTPFKKEGFTIENPQAKLIGVSVRVT